VIHQVHSCFFGCREINCAISHEPSSSFLRIRFARGNVNPRLDSNNPANVVLDDPEMVLRAPFAPIDPEFRTTPGSLTLFQLCSVGRRAARHLVCDLTTCLLCERTQCALHYHALCDARNFIEAFCMSCAPLHASSATLHTVQRVSCIRLAQRVFGYRSRMCKISCQVVYTVAPAISR
jgi:hypothetical protein